jgi:hypothetical protein
LSPIDTPSIVVGAEIAAADQQVDLRRVSGEEHGGLSG